MIGTPAEPEYRPCLSIRMVWSPAAAPGLNVIRQIVTDKQDPVSGYSGSSDCCLEYFRMWFGVAGFAGYRNGVKVGKNFQAFHHRINAGIEVRYDAELVLQPAEFLQNFQRFRKQTPSPAVAKLFVDIVEEPIEIGDHSHIVEDAVDDIFPPLFFIIGGQRTGVPELPDKGGLDFRR